jgi:hypothetical protein
MEDISYCARGLFTPRLLERRSRDTQRSIQAVLNEQDRQRTMGLNRTRHSLSSTTTSSSSNHDDNGGGCSYDSNLLAEVYRGYCLHCQLDAERLGRQDAMAAAKIYQEEEDGDYCTAPTTANTPTTEPTSIDRITASSCAPIETTRRSKSQSPPLSRDKGNNNSNNSSNSSNSNNNTTNCSEMVRTSTIQRRRRFPWSVSGSL